MGGGVQQSVVGDIKMAVMLCPVSQTLEIMPECTFIIISDDTG